MANEHTPTTVAIEDVVHAAAKGVLRALDVRGAGAAFSAAELVRSGFVVDFFIRAGGIPGPLLRQGGSVDLNPQPLPPGDSSLSQRE